MGLNSFPLIEDEEVHSDDDIWQVGFTAPSTPGVEQLIWAEEIDQDWVFGETARPPFDRLSVSDRQLLKWRYADGERATQIAKRTSEHPNTCREHLRRAKLRLDGIISEHFKESGEWLY